MVEQNWKLWKFMFFSWLSFSKGTAMEQQTAMEHLKIFIWESID